MHNYLSKNQLQAMQVEELTQNELQNTDGGGIQWRRIGRAILRLARRSSICQDSGESAGTSTTPVPQKPSWCYGD
jgi:hypothetical protein